MQTEQKAGLVHLFGPYVRFDVPLAQYSSFRIGGLADVLVEPNSLEELQTLICFVTEEHEPFFLLGGGTNVLISDNGIRGVVIRPGRGFDYTEWQEQPRSALVTVGAGRSLGRFVREAARKEYGGVEFAEGIPGTVGGGLLMNAGAFGGELSDVVQAVTGVNSAGQSVRLLGADLGFAYRKTALPEQFIVGEVEFHLSRKNQTSIAASMGQAREKRRRAQPHGYPNAGSIFKNPPGMYAGRMIEAVGCKGSCNGSAKISERHANFIVNTGGATATQVWQLIEHVQRVVWQEKQVWLEPEIRRVGEW